MNAGADRMPDRMRRFILDHMRLTPVPLVSGISLYAAHPGSGLSRVAGDRPPYWAYPWAGGLALARYLLDTPDAVAGRRVLDLGTGSGLVAIAAARAGAARVLASDTDPAAMAAAALNAEANGIAFDLTDRDVLVGALPEVDTVLMGDVFYHPDVAGRMLSFARRCRAGGIGVLIGDPLRPDLPRDALEQIAEYAVPDFGDTHGGGGRRAGVFVPL